MNRELKEFRRLERACREHAAVASFDLEREGLLKVADDYRKAIEGLQKSASIRQ
ncbi:hypothetical protein KUL72_12080 [Bradyrhizobium arachidis]|uniref:hypothetical protein n=1 Tax=Bradyrhizobium TaxID=374 RepID=UPI00188A382F|nr:MULTISPECIES: hypothetical protein [Bradyrhizobium]MDN4983953.1 hypothetical protein [Bradyrhizobium sp. WYCCWR 13022]UVO39038.1 hypothetical protein KUL72_12080 [Bradyrhizobium arachidis]